MHPTNRKQEIQMKDGAKQILVGQSVTAKILIG
jgi:hypothetical protein